MRDDGSGGAGVVIAQQTANVYVLGWGWWCPCGSCGQFNAQYYATAKRLKRSTRTGAEGLNLLSYGKPALRNG